MAMPDKSVCHAYFPLRVPRDGIRV
jgi:hypothetical protein